MGRATQGVRLINLAKKNDIIASVCKVMSSELEATVEEESHQKMLEKNEQFDESTVGEQSAAEAPAEDTTTPDDPETQA